MDTYVSLFEWVNHLYLFVIRLNASKKSVQSIWQTIQTICISVQNKLASVQSEVTFVQLVLTSIQLFFQSHPTFRFNNFFTATFTSFSKQKNEILNILIRFFLTVILNKKCNYAQRNIYCFTHSGISPLGSTILRVSCIRLYFIILSADVVDVSEGEAFTCK